MFKKYIAPVLVFLIYRFLVFTWKIEIRTSQEFDDLVKSGQPLVIGHWHGDELALMPLVKTYKICTMVSTSTDGNIMNFVFNKMGGHTSRGSSTRGGVGALKGVLRLMKQGCITTIAVDGPKGPIYKAKPGIFEISKLTKAHIVPMAADASNAKVFEKAWNKTYLPKIGSKVVIYIGKPQTPISKSDNVHDDSFKEQLEQEIFAAKHQATKIIATI